MSINPQELEVLVKSLHPSEKGYFRKTNRKNSLYMDLFDLLIEEGVYVQEKVEKLVSGKRTSAYFSNLRSFLKDRIMDSLRSYRLSKNIQLQLDASLANADLYKERALARLEQIELRHAYDLAQQLDQVELCQRIRMRMGSSAKLRILKDTEEQTLTNISKLRHLSLQIEMREYDLLIVQLLEKQSVVSSPMQEVLINTAKKCARLVKNSINQEVLDEKLMDTIVRIHWGCALVLSQSANDYTLETETFSPPKGPLGKFYQLNLLNSKKGNNKELENAFADQFYHLTKNKEEIEVIANNLPNLLSNISIQNINKLYEENAFEKVKSISFAFKTALQLCYPQNSNNLYEVISEEEYHACFYLAISCLQLTETSAALDWLSFILPNSGKHINISKLPLGTSPFIYSLYLHLLNDNLLFLESHQRNISRLIKRSSLESSESIYLLSFLRKITGKRYRGRELNLLKEEENKFLSLSISDSSQFPQLDIPLIYRNLENKFAKAMA